MAGCIARDGVVGAVDRDDGSLPATDLFDSAQRSVYGPMEGDVRVFFDEARRGRNEMPAIRIVETRPRAIPALDGVTDHHGGHGAIGHAPAPEAGRDVQLAVSTYPADIREPVNAEIVLGRPAIQGFTDTKSSAMTLSNTE